MVQEILDLGFAHIELGYNLTLGLVPGVLEMVNRGSVTVTSVHNFCPVPTGAPCGHPELFSLCSTNKHVWDAAQRHTTETIEFAAQVKAPTMVVHAGRVPMTHLTTKLMGLCDAGKRYHPKFDRTKDKLLLKREKKAPKYVERLHASIAQLLPILEKNKVCMALENLPSWETIPNETEMQDIIDKFSSPWIAYWHDIGHGQVRQNLTFINHLGSLDNLAPNMAGMHVHDVSATAHDHLMPPRGDIDFSHFKRFIKPDTVLVLEPAPGTPGTHVVEAKQILEKAWAQDEEA